ncbi:MAG: hypothetical protein ACFE0R_09625, partial [Salinarimonas sp.]
MDEPTTKPQARRTKRTRRGLERTVLARGAPARAHPPRMGESGLPSFAPHLGTRIAARRNT